MIKLIIIDTMQTVRVAEDITRNVVSISYKVHRKMQTYSWQQFSNVFDYC
jgi:hypothetical protein